MWFDAVAFYQLGARVHKTRDFSAHMLLTICEDPSLLRGIEASHRVSSHMSFLFLTYSNYYLL